MPCYLWSMEIGAAGQNVQAPRGDESRQAVAALRGYGYQIYASALAWLGLGDNELLYLEVAEDFATVTRDALAGTQVKDTAASGAVTLRSAGVRSAIDAFVDLVSRNPGRIVSLHYLTTSVLGTERSAEDRIGNEAALAYWRRAAAGAEVGPLRALLDRMHLALGTKSHLAAMSDEEFATSFLARIHWHCGAPGLQDVRADLVAGLVEYVGTNRGLSSHVGRNMVSTVVERILLTAVSKESRRLRRADLLMLVDEASRVSVPVDQLARAFGGRAGAEGFLRPSLILPVNELPLPEPLVPRTRLVETIDQLRASSGAVFVVGATGLGKSLAAKLVAARTGRAWSIIDFRDLNAADTAARLSLILAELAVSPPTGLILDDLNCVEDHGVRDMTARLLVALRRRDVTGIVTAYSAPASSTLHALSPRGVPVVEVQYLSEEEVATLVVDAGGEARYAGSIHRAASFGHPQLTMGIVQRLVQAEWRRADLAALLGGASGSDFAGERRAARQRLMIAMPVESTRLLLRMSLVEGGFDRALGLALGELSPQVPLAGMVLDRLVGPWIEPVRRDKLRVSPLLEGAANEVLSQTECRAIHHCIAERLMGRRTLSVLDAEPALRHALGSGDAILIAAFANSILTCGEDMLGILAPFTGTLRRFPFAEPILPDEPRLSATLRFAQLMVLLPEGSPDEVRRCFTVLELELADVANSELLESAVLVKVLMHERAGSIFQDWPDMLIRADALARSDTRLADANSDYQKRPEAPPDVTGVLLASQMRSIVSVAAFRSLVERIDREQPDFRERCLSSFVPGRSDLSILVNQGWLQESREPGFDWEAAANDYEACAAVAISWGNAVLAVRCAIARAMCFDENGHDPNRALACLDDAARRFGPDVALVRARARVHWRQRDHAAALPLLAAAAEAGGQEPLERLFIAREAGISAADLGDWLDAERWFERAHAAAVLVPHVLGNAYAIGLLADMGHAACRAGAHGRALGLFREAVRLLPTIDPNGTLAESYCHRIVRNGVLWFLRTVKGIADADDREVAYPAGCGSKPDPMEAIRSHPVANIDYAFYLLAEADLALAEPTGYHLSFRDDLIGEPILSVEISSSIGQIRRAITRHDTRGFVSRVLQHVATSEIVRSGAFPETPEAMSDPFRGTIPSATLGTEEPVDARRAAEDFVLTFAIVAALSGDFEAVDAASEAGLQSAELEMLHPLFRRMIGGTDSPNSDCEGVASAIYTMRADLRGNPLALLWCGLWLLLHLRWTSLREFTSGRVVAWIFEGWSHLVTQGRFLLASPALSAPPIENILSQPARTPAAAARLTLAARAAAATAIPAAVTEHLKEMAESEGSPAAEGGPRG
ncbi:hypothetical protein [Methylobacterium sp. J-092]|uniref:hypothetical protein n=1 Tax=Methylobacterium sp. J-092 TaxID=2836667 RepID=UPI001FBA59A3|nr:hypothetical protein [Methylobacterium sp. J-092]MCJ2010437.1 hypothetical protein [Methylobacterium sp. J-092]